MATSARGSLALCAPLEPSVHRVDDGQNFDSTMSSRRSKNQQPVVASYEVTVVDGERVEITVVATHRETPTAELLVRPVGPLPPGVSWNPARRVPRWDSPGAVGTYKPTMLLDDGESQPPKAKYVIKAIPPAERPASPSALCRADRQSPRLYHRHSEFG